MIRYVNNFEVILSVVMRPKRRRITALSADAKPLADTSETWRATSDEP